MEPAAREVERVAGLHGHVENRLAGRAHLRHVLLVLQRQLEDGRVDEPALLAFDLEAEDVVGVVVNREALGAGGRVVGVRLGRMAELGLELSAERRQRRMLHLEGLQDDRRAARELRRDTFDAGRPREWLRRPRDVLRVVGEDDLLALLDDAESRPAQASFRDAPLDFGDREEVVKAPLLVTWDEEGLLLPIIVEEAIRLDGLEAAR